MPRRCRCRRRTAGRGHRPAFTLVELLVVIGIIALLIAMLLPALSRAREQADTLRCVATLRAMGQAAQLHAAEHDGYMPLAGLFPDLYPKDLGDVRRTRYTYYVDPLGPIHVPAPVSASLAVYMNLRLE